MVLDLASRWPQRHSMRFLPILAITCLAVSCAPPSSRTPESRALQETGGYLSQVKMPVIRSSYFEKNWGQPDVTTFEDGGYRLRYRQGTTLNYVFIQGLAKADPVPATPPDWTEEVWDDRKGTLSLAYHKQPWRETTILGTRVKWYQNDSGGGADFPCYKTVDFTLTGPDGRTGAYRISVCTTNAEEATDWITRVNW